MALALGLAFLTLRSGLALRRSRLRRAGRAPDLRPRHLRLAKPAIVLVVVGFAGGLGSWAWLRGGDVLGTFHGVVGVLVTTCPLVPVMMTSDRKAAEADCVGYVARSTRTSELRAL